MNGSIWPPVVYLALTALACVMAVRNHGSPRITDNNAYGRLIESAILLAILLWGGFFAPLLGGR